MSKAQTKAATQLLVMEIVRGRDFLGTRTTEEEYQQLQAGTIPELIQEAQALAAAIQLRQQREIGENVRAAIAFDSARRSPRNGPLMS